MNRRSFLKLGGLLVPAAAAPRVAYSFLVAPEGFYVRNPYPIVVPPWIAYTPGSNANGLFAEAIRRAEESMRIILLPPNYRVELLSGGE